MLADILLVGGVAVAVVSALQRPRVAPEAFRDLGGAEAAIREALRGDEAGTVRAEFRGRGVQSPERRLDTIPFGWR